MSFVCIIIFCIYWFQKQPSGSVCEKLYSYNFKKLSDISQNLWKILGRISLLDLSISKVLDCQLAILVKNRLLSRICILLRKTLSRNTSEWLLLVFSQCYFNTEITVKQILKQYQLIVSNFYLPIFLIPYKIQQTPTII